MRLKFEMLKNSMKNSSLSILFIGFLWCLSFASFARDGTLRHHYTFDENWSSQVTDSAGNINGTLTNAFSISRVDETAAGNFSDGCYAAQFSGGGIIELNNTKVKTGNNQINSFSFWMKWNGTNSQMPMAFSLYDLWLFNSKFGFNSWVNNVYGINSSAVNNQWVHVAAVFKNGDMGSNKLYINGIEQTLSGTISNGNADATRRMSIGGHISRRGSDYRFNGIIDEFKIYNGEISSTQITNDMAAVTNGCGANVSAIELTNVSTESEANICAVDGYRLRLLDSSNQVINGAGTTVNLSSGDSRGSWSVREGLGTINSNADDNGQASYTFSTLDNGEVILDFIHNEPGTVNLSAQVNSLSSNVSRTFSENDPTMAWKLEAGNFVLTSSNARSSYQRVQFKQAYPYPPIVTINPTDQESDPTEVRVKNITTTGFDVSTLSYEPGQNISAMNLSYIAVEPGRHQFNDGRQVEACVVSTRQYHNKNDSGSSERSISFTSAFNQTPTVITKLQSVNNTIDRGNDSYVEPWFSAPSRSTTATGTNITLERSESVTGTINSTEVVGYIAINANITSTFQSNSGVSVNVESVTTADFVVGRNDSISTIPTQLSFSSPPLWAGSKMTQDGVDGGWVVRHNVSNNGVFVTVDEDNIDGERNHTTERLGIILFDRAFDAIISQEVLDNLIDYTEDGARVVQITGNNVTAWNSDLNGTPSDNWRPQGSLWSTEQPDSLVSFKVNTNSGATWNGNTSAQAYGILVIDAQREITSDILAASNMHSDGQATHIQVFAYDGPTPANIEIPASVLSPANSDNSPAYNANGWVEVLSKSSVNQNPRNNLTSPTRNSVAMTRYNLPQEHSARWWKVHVYNDGSGSPSDPNYIELRSFKIFGEVTPELVDHFRFEFSPTGLTCAASDVVLRACKDANCANNATINTSFTLSPANQWTGADVTGNIVSFTGTTNLKLSQNTLGTIGLSGSGFNPSPSNSTPIQCFSGGSSVNCEIAFKDTGFLFNTIPTQISGKPSNVEFNQKDLTIQAIAKNPTTGACENVFANNTDVVVQLKTNCHADIGSCSNAFITKDGGSIAEQISGTYSDVTLKFGSNSTALYSYEYFNAGEMSLSARKVVTLPSGSTATLEDSSNSFVIRPFGFKLIFPEDSDPYSDGNPSGDFSKFKPAGEAFKINAVPIMWQSGEDGDVSVPSSHDGNIDADENANDNAVVANFAGESVKLAHQLVLPTVAQGGIAGDFTANDTALVNSIASFVDARWNEVGIINISADLVDGNYRGGGNVIGYVNGVGRFYPDHFTVSDLVVGDLTGQCINQTFIGETTADGADSGTAVDGALKYYSTNPAMRINAMAAGATLPLNNYRGVFMRLQDSSVTFNTTSSVNGLTVNSVIDIGTVNEVGGIVTFTMSDNDNFVFTRNNTAKVAPFPAALNFPVAEIEDQDEVVLKADVSATLSASSKADHQVVYGRVKLHNAFGPDNQALAMPVEHQMYNGSKFVTNTVIGAGCSYPVTPSSDFSLTPSPFGDLTAASLTTPVTWLSGEASLQIPASNLSGELQLEFDVPVWLRFDWDNNAGSADTNPRANAVFGRYRGNDRIINWRERR